ncbi:MAG: septal ring lytic transglycosylase RlpA family protein, partial [bacterium]|nr:septal ring lytic transglycosylase RlpA family protein [bacterium]
MSLFIRLLSACVCALILAGCGSTKYDVLSKTPAPKRATSKTYRIRGVTYHPQQHYEYVETGRASHYGEGDIFHGRPTATGERFDRNKVTGAHRTLPLPCIVRVTNLDNGRTLKVKVNDRGPYFHLKGPTRRIIDLSAKAAKLLGFFRKGTANVRVEVLVGDSKRVGRTRLGKGWNSPRKAKVIKPQIIKAQITSLGKNIANLLKEKPRRRASVPKAKPRRTSPSTNQSISTLLQVLGDVTTGKSAGR